MSQRREKRLRALEDRVKMLEASYAHRLRVENIGRRVEEQKGRVSLVERDVLQLRKELRWMKRGRREAKKAGIDWLPLVFSGCAVAVAIAGIVQACPLPVVTEDSTANMAVEKTVDTVDDDPMESEYIEAALLEQGYFHADIPLPLLEQDYLRTACEEFDVPYVLALGLIQTESGFRNVSGDDGKSVGYMQVQERYHTERMEALGVADLWDPYQHFRTGCSLLGEYLEECGDVHQALMVYNMGHSGAAKLWGQGIYQTDYSRKVVQAAEEWGDKLG